MKDSKIQRFKDSRIQGFKDSKIQGFKNYKATIMGLGFEDLLSFFFRYFFAGKEGFV
jgi:hypothetical protein